MYCNNCGKENAESTSVCIHCGLEITPTALKIPEAYLITNAGQYERSTSGFSEKISEKIKSNKEKFKKICIFSVIGLVVIVSAVLIIGKISSIISLEDYITDNLEITGLNGYGTISQEYDDILNAEALEAEMGTTAFKNYIGISLEDEEENGSYSNGDEINFVINIDKKGINKDKNIKKTIVGDDELKHTYVVSGLEDGVAIDIFDAVEYYFYDPTEASSWFYSSNGLKYKSDYKKSYDGGIEVGISNGYIRVYGENFNSFSVGIERVNDKEVDADTKSVKYRLSCDSDKYAELGIVFAPVEKEIPVVSLSYVTDTISKEDINILTEKANEAACEKVNDNPKLSFVKLYWGEGVEPVLAYFYDHEGDDREEYKTGWYEAVYYSGLKIRSDDSSVYNVEDQELHYKEVIYNSSQDFSDYIIEAPVQSVDIAVK